MGFYESSCLVEEETPLKNRVVGSRGNLATRARFPASEPLESHQETTVIVTIFVSDRQSFWSMDVWGGRQSVPRSAHKYVFAENNAINLVDPSGFSPSLAEVMFVVGTIGMLNQQALGTTLPSVEKPTITKVSQQQVRGANPHGYGGGAFDTVVYEIKGKNAWINYSVVVWMKGRLTVNGTVSSLPNHQGQGKHDFDFPDYVVDSQGDDIAQPPSKILTKVDDDTMRFADEPGWNGLWYNATSVKGDLEFQLNVYNAYLVPHGTKCSRFKSVTDPQPLASANYTVSIDW